ncbi:MAG: hypothetical protein V7709_09705 [Halioglobus sp.]
MNKLIGLILAFALITTSASGNAFQEAKLNILGQQIVGNDLLIRLESLVYVRSWGGHGTGADKQTGYIARYNLNTQRVDIYGPLYRNDDEIHWQDLVQNKQLNVRMEDTNGELINPEQCTATRVVMYRPNALEIGKPGAGCRQESTDEWLNSVAAAARNMIGPNGGVFDKVTLDKKFYLPSFEARYYRGDPAQSVSPQGGEYRKEYTTFSLGDKTYNRAEFGFYFERKSDSHLKNPAELATLYPKRCKASLGQDKTIPISVNGELRFICSKNAHFEIKTPQGDILNRAAHSDQGSRGFMHSPASNTVYWIKRKSINSMDALQLTSWNYQTNTLKDSLISFNPLFLKGFFSGTFEPLEAQEL